MPSNNAFTLKGAVTPSFGLGLSASNHTTTPQYVVRADPTPLQSAYGEQGNKIGYGSSKIGGQPGLIAASTPLKSHTTSADGSVTQTFHAPLAPANNSTTTPQKPAPAPTPTSSVNIGAPTSASFPGLVNTLANQGTSGFNNLARGEIGNLTSAAAGNQVYADRARNIADEAGKTITDIGRAGARGQAGYLSTGTSPVAEGNAAILAQTTAAQQQAASQGAQMQLEGNSQGLTAQNQKQSGFNSAASQALTGQNYQQGAISNAAGYAQPTPNTAFYGNPLSGGVAGVGNSLLSSNISQALQLIKNGASNQDPAVQALISPFGAIGVSALTQALNSNGGYNPTAQNAIAQQNTTQGSQTQQQAFNLNLGLQNLKALQPQVVQFIQNSPLNKADSPLYGKAINQYIATLGNTAAAQQLSAMMNDIKAFGSQIISSKSAGTPTSNDEMTAATDPSLLTAKQLQTVLNTWDSLGQTNLKVLQSNSQNAYGGMQGYTGPTASPTPFEVGAPNTSPGSGINDPASQFGAGLGLGAGSWAMSQANNIGGELLTFLGGLSF